MACEKAGIPPKNSGFFQDGIVKSSVCSVKKGKLNKISTDKTLSIFTFQSQVYPKGLTKKGMKVTSDLHILGFF